MIVVKSESRLGWQVGSYAVRDIEEYRNFCDRPKNQRPQPEETLGVRSFVPNWWSFRR